MKRFFTYITALVLACGAALASPHALFVKDKDGVRKFAFGVAGDLTFSSDGKTLYIKGYEAGIDLSKVEYMTFDMPVDGQMSSTQHKDRLLKIGEELNSKINANDASDIIGFAAEFDNLSYLDQDAFFEDFKKNHPDLFDDDDDEYYKSKLRSAVKSMASVATGDFAATREIGAVFTELFTRKDLTGIFKADTEAGKWVKTGDADYFEIVFQGPAMGKNYSMRIEASPEYTEWSESIKIKEYDGSTSTYNVTGRAPKSVTCTVKMQNTEIFNGVVGVALNQSAKSIDITTNVSCAKVKVDDKLAIRNTSCTDDLTVYINGEKILSNSVDMKGSQLLNIDEWADDIQGILCEYCAENYNEYHYDVDGRKVVRRFGSVTTNTDILGQLQVQGHVANYDKSYDELEEYIEENDDAYSLTINEDKHLITRTYGLEYWQGKIASVVNNYTDASFYYDNKPQTQGFLIWKVYEDINEYDWPWENPQIWDEEKQEYIQLTGEYYERYIEYEIMPYLTFSDGSSFAFDSTYFTGSNFRKLVNDAEDIADIINNILSDYEYERPWDR